MMYISFNIFEIPFFILKAPAVSCFDGTVVACSE
uniref:Uncharacterized protein n=1 Tax=Anguilla anguilla TaxID=7936 RepID=A0A0E9XEW9_ANGAN